MMAPIHAFDAEHDAGRIMQRARWRALALPTPCTLRKRTCALTALAQAIDVYQAARWRASWWERALLARARRD